MHHGPSPLTRRRFLAMAGLATVAACTPESPAVRGAAVTTPPSGTEPRFSTTSTQPDTTPVTGGTLQVASPSVPNVDPLKWADIEIQRMYRLAVESLYDPTPDGGMEPLLAAEAPTVSRDGLVIRVGLRGDAVFHDGTRLDTDAVVESFRRAADPANASQWLVRLGTALDRVEAAGNDVVAFRLRRPFAPFSTMLGRIPVLPATGRYEPQLTFARELVGTGPFLLDSWADDRVTFAAFDDHHGGRPPLDGIEFRLSADPLSDALDGRAHLAATESGFEQAQVGAAGFSLAVAERSTVRTVALANLDRNRPTSAHLARLAIATAVDRTAIVDDVLGGIGEPCTAVLAPSTPGSAELSESGIGVRPDFDAAAEAFAASRSSTARPFTIVTGDSRIAGAIAEHVARGCRELGFDASVEPLAPAVLAARLAVTDPDDPGDYDLAVVGAHTQPAGGYGPDYAYFGLRSGLPTNLNKVDDPQLDVLLDAAAVDNSVDGWREVQAYDIASGLYQIPLVAGRHAEAVAPTVIGFEASGLGTLERLGEVRLG